MSWTAPKVIPLEAPVSRISFLRDRLIPARLLIPAAAFSSGWLQDGAAFISTSPHVGFTSGGWGQMADTIHLSPLHVPPPPPLSTPFSSPPPLDVSSSDNHDRSSRLKLKGRNLSL